MSNITYFSPYCLKESFDVFFGHVMWGRWYNSNISSYINNFLMEQYSSQLNLITKPKNKILTILCNNQSEVFIFFVKNVLRHISIPFIIVSFGGDETFPAETRERCKNINENYFDTIIHSKYFKHWFAVNKVFPDNKYFTSIPFGLNYWCLTDSNIFGLNKCSILEQDKTMLDIVKNLKPFTERIPKIYINWQHNITDVRHGNWRRQLPNILPSDITYYSNNIPRTTYWQECSNYVFVVSPHGNGLDCIRTWEALTLGCIVIVKKSPIDNLYDDLPVVIVNEWTEINKDFLNDILISFSSKKFNYDKLTMNYWMEKINQQL